MEDDFMSRDIDEWDELEEDDEVQDHSLDPAFSSWDDYFRYKYG